MPTTTKRASDLRRRMMIFIGEYSTEYGYSPSIRDIGDQFGMSTSHVHFHLEKLKKDGKIKWEPKKARTIKVIT